MRTSILLISAFLVLCLAAIPAGACSCGHSGATACSALSATPVVFVGTVTKDSGEGNGGGLGRMRVDEVLHGLPKDIGEVDADTMARTSCYMRLEEGSRVVLYGSQDPKNPKLIHYHACSFSFRVAGNETLLDALRNAETGGPPRLVGSVTKRVEKYGGGARADGGIKVVAQKDDERLETFTAGDGQFEFRVINPGSWKLNIERPGLVDDLEYSKNLATVPANGCDAQRLSAVADGHIRGMVTDREGHGISGIAVQVFTLDTRQKEIDSSKFAEAITSSTGTYDIGKLPPQDYFLGINAEKYDDKIAYPPTYYGSTNRNEAKRIALKEAEEINGIDLVLAPARKKATLIIELHYDDGTIVTATGIPRNATDPHPPITSFIGANIEDMNGVQRVFIGDPGLVVDGKMRASVWADETYVVKAHRMEDGPLIVNPDGSVRLGKFTNWEGTSGPIRITEPETTVRVVIFEKPLGGK